MDSQLALYLPAPRNTPRRSTVDRARVERDAAIESVADKAGAAWTELAFEFLRRYAVRNALFTPEDVTDAMAIEGQPQPHDLRAWGAVYQRARRAKLIEKSKTETYQRRFGHATVSFKWRSLICEGGAT
jgi:hypothetical protein